MPSRSSTRASRKMPPMKKMMSATMLSRLEPVSCPTRQRVCNDTHKTAENY
jgi:hypothetical protein